MKSALEKSILFFASLVVFNTPTFAFGTYGNSCPKFGPYIGVEAGQGYYRLTKVSGPNLFKKRFPEGKIFGGFNFNDFIGIEAGYKSTTLRTKFPPVGASDSIFGELPINPPEVHLTRAQYKGWIASLMGYLPICDYPVSLIGSAGITRLNVFLYETILLDNFDGATQATNFAENSHTFKSKKYIPTLGLGIQSLICNTFGIRFKFDWENTSRFKNMRPVEDTIDLSKARSSLRNALTYNLGFFIPF